MVTVLPVAPQRPESRPVIGQCRGAAVPVGQQMRWTPQGAHLLLQVRVHVLNDELGAAFQRWYPQIGSWQEAQLAA